MTGFGSDFANDVQQGYEGAGPSLLHERSTKGPYHSPQEHNTVNTRVSDYDVISKLIINSQKMTANRLRLKMYFELSIKMYFDFAKKKTPRATHTHLR